MLTGVDVLVCVKRVPMVGGKIVILPNGCAIDTRMSGFTVSPHEECAVEEAVRLTERGGGTVTVLTLGPPEAADQLRDALALGASRAVLLETDGREWGPMATAGAIVAAIDAAGQAYDLLLFGNESADTGGYQVPVRVAHALGLPCATGIKGIELATDGGRVTARREHLGAEETFDLPLPAVISVKEGINLPRYPSLPGRLRAKRAGIERFTPDWRAEGLAMTGLRVPAAERHRAEILGTGTDAVPALVTLLAELGVLS